MVDDADYEWLNQWKWYANRIRGVRDNYYARRNVKREDGTRTPVSMHMQLLPGLDRIDHKDGDGLNNTRKNLRESTHRQNLQNRRKAAPATSRYKGVCWDGKRIEGKNWIVQIRAEGVNRWLGGFGNEIEAAKAYDAAAIKYFGEFARLNFPKRKNEIDLI